MTNVSQIREYWGFIVHGNLELRSNILNAIYEYALVRTGHPNREEE